MNIRNRFGFLFLVTAFLGVANAAAADETSSCVAPSPPLSETRSAEATAPKVWYGWQTLTVDGASTALAIASVPLAASSSDNRAGTGMLLAAAGTFALGAPIVHLMNHQPLRALGSFGLHVGLPVMGYLLGFAATSRCESSEFLGCLNTQLASIATGFIIGATAAVAIDSSALAYKPAPPPSSVSWSVSPQLDPAGRTYGLSIVASGF